MFRMQLFEYEPHSYPMAQPDKVNLLVSKALSALANSTVAGKRPADYGSFEKFNI